MAEDPRPVDAADLWHAFFGTLRSIAAAVVALGILWGGTWFAFQPRVDGYFEAKLEPMTREVERLSAQLETLNRLMGQETTPFIEFFGNGKLIEEGPFVPGQRVGVLYMVRRNQPCASTVRVEFFSEQERGVVSQYSHEIQGVNAPVTTRPIQFPIYIDLPRNLRPGRYSYTPMMIPDREECPRASIVPVPPSDFFEVERNG